jgi:hypothetical protein
MTLPKILGRLLALLSLVLLLTASAEAVSLHDIIELSRAGLGDEVLVALIETDGTVFTLDADRILELRAGGVSDAVIVAMLRQGRTPLPEPPAAPVEPLPVPSEETFYPAPAAPAQNTVVVVPTVVPWPFTVGFGAPAVHQQRFVGRPFDSSPGLGRFLNNGLAVGGPVAGPLPNTPGGFYDSFHVPPANTGWPFGPVQSPAAPSRRR